MNGKLPFHRLEQEMFDALAHHNSGNEIAILDTLCEITRYRDHFGIQNIRAMNVNNQTFRNIEREFVEKITGIWETQIDVAMKEMVQMMDTINQEVSEELVTQLILPFVDEHLGKAFYEGTALKSLLKKTIDRTWASGKNFVAALSKKPVPRSAVIDYRAKTWMQADHRFWLRHRYDSYIRERISDTAIKVGIEQGLGRRDIGRILATAFTGTAKEGAYYWEVVGAAAVTRGRSWSAITTYDQLEIPGYTWLTMGDERVCEICGPLDGTHFATKTGYDHMMQTLDIQDDPYAARNMTPWIGIDQKKLNAGDEDFYYTSEVDETGDILSKSYFTVETLKDGELMAEKGVVTPQAHGGCRCGTLPD